MSRMADMHGTIEELRAAAAAVNEAADRLCQQFSGDEAPAKAGLKLEDVRAVLADMSRQGRTAQIRALLQKYGAERLSAVDPQDYEALLEDAEAIGDGG